MHFALPRPGPLLIAMCALAMPTGAPALASDDHVTLTTPLLGLLAGVQQLRFRVSSPVVALDVHLDGKSCSQATPPSWTSTCDLGSELHPHLLEAESRDANGKTLDVLRRTINCHPLGSEAEIVVERTSDGVPRTARIVTRSLEFHAPEHVDLLLDGKPLPLDSSLVARLPTVNSGGAHVLSARVQYSASKVVSADTSFGGAADERAWAELTAYAVVTDKDADEIRPARLEGEVIARGEAAKVVAVESGPAEVVIVPDGAARDRIRAWDRELSSLRLRGGLSVEDKVRVVVPHAAASEKAVLFDVSQAVDGSTSQILALLAATTGHRDDQSLADATAVAATRASESNRPRAVVLLLAGGLNSKDRFATSEVRKYVRELNVPLVVWNVRSEISNAPTAWGDAQAVVTGRDFVRALRHLKQFLTRQRIIWVEGSYLPIELTLRSDPGDVLGVESAVAMRGVDDAPLKAAGPAHGAAPATGMAGANAPEAALSVIDPSRNRYRSVPGLSAEDLVIRIDGVVQDARGGVRVTETCSPSDDARSIVTIVDFNSLDARERRFVAAALDRMAAATSSTRIPIKIYGLTRQLRRITPGFTRDPDEVAVAAQFVRSTAAVASLPAGRNGTADMPWQRLDDESALAVETSSGPIRDYDETDTVAALEAVMDANAAVPGRKAVVLFTSAKNRPRTERPAHDPRVERSRNVLWRGYTVWVNTEATPVTPLVGWSGGGIARGEFARSLESILDQLACYYRLELPTISNGVHDLDVSVDAGKRRELWGLRVEAPGKFLLADRDQRARARAETARLTPDDFADPSVVAELQYPDDGAATRAITARFRVALAESSGSVAIRASVQHGASPSSRCTLQDDVEVPSVTGTRDTDLLFEIRCPLETAGEYVASVTVIDPTRGTSRAARSAVLVRAPLEQPIGAVDPVLEVSTGRDLVWDQRGAPRIDPDRMAWKRIHDGRAAPTDRIRLRFLACGKAPRIPARFTLVSVRGATRERREVLPTPLARSDRAVDCEPFVADVAQLAPGDYAFVNEDDPSQPELAFSIGAKR